MVISTIFPYKAFIIPLPHVKVTAEECSAKNSDYYSGKTSRNKILYGATLTFVQKKSSYNEFGKSCIIFLFTLGIGITLHITLRIDWMQNAFTFHMSEQNSLVLTACFSWAYWRAYIKSLSCWCWKQSNNMVMLVCMSMSLYAFKITIARFPNLKYVLDHMVLKCWFISNK